MNKRVGIDMGSGAGGAIISPTNKSRGGTELCRVLVLKNNFKDLFDNTWDIGNFGVHLFCPQMTQELPKKRHEVGPPEQLPTDGLSQIDYRHTRHCEEALPG